MTPLTAQDLWPLVAKLSRDEQVRLAKLALATAAQTLHADIWRYRASSPAPDEFSSTDDPLAWDGDCWNGLDAPR